MAAGRERRGNAGSKMAKLLNEEEEDEFYKTTYGGFEEVEDDRVCSRITCIFKCHLARDEVTLVIRAYCHVKDNRMCCAGVLMGGIISLHSRRVERSVGDDTDV